MQGHHTLKGTAIHKLQPQFAVFGGVLASQKEVTTAVIGSKKLQHVEAGLLSVHQDGSHFAITLGRALALDSDYIVIGRVGKGTHVLMRFNDVETDIEDAPEGALTIAACGTTDHKGQNDTISSVNAASTSQHAAGEAAREGVAAASSAVLCAVAAGLKRKGGAGDARGAKSRKGARMGMLSDDDGDSDNGSDGS